MDRADNTELSNSNGILIEQDAGVGGELSLTTHHTPASNPAIAYLMSLGSNKSRQTMGAFLNIIAKMIGFKGIYDCDWGSLRRHHVLAVIDRLTKSERAPSTINTYLSALKGVALEGWILQLIDTDSYQHIKHIKSVKGSRLTKGRSLSTEEIKRIFFTCESDRSAIGVRDAAIISVLIGCGLRRTEVITLNYSDYDRRDNSLKVLGKGNKERLSFLPRGTQKRLDSWIEEVRGDCGGPLFTRIRRHGDLTHERLSSQAVYHILESRRVQSGIEKFAPHDLRRTFASSMLANGEDIITVKDAMGHASLTTTQKYDYRGSERLREASERLNIT